MNGNWLALALGLFSITSPLLAKQPRCAERLDWTSSPARHAEAERRRRAARGDRWFGDVIGWQFVSNEGGREFIWVGGKSYELGVDVVLGEFGSAFFKGGGAYPPLPTQSPDVRWDWYGPALGWQEATPGRSAPLPRNF